MKDTTDGKVRSIEAENLNVPDRLREQALEIIPGYVMTVLKKGRMDQILLLIEVVNALIDGRYVKAEINELRSFDPTSDD